MPAEETSTTVPFVPPGQTVVTGLSVTPPEFKPIPAPAPPVATIPKVTVEARVVPEAPAPKAVAGPQKLVTRARDDNDVLGGHFGQLIAGEHAGTIGVYLETVTSGADGYPLTVVIRTRDDRDELLTVPYSDLRPVAAGGR